MRFRCDKCGFTKAALDTVRDFSFEHDCFGIRIAEERAMIIESAVAASKRIESSEIREAFLLLAEELTTRAYGEAKR